MVVYTTNGKLDAIGTIKVVNIMNEDCIVVEIKPNIYIREVDGVLYLDKIFSLNRLDEKSINSVGLKEYIDKGIIVKKTITPKPAFTKEKR